MHLSFFLLLALLAGLVLIDWRQTLYLLTLPSYRLANPLIVALVARNGTRVALLWGPLFLASVASAVAYLAGLILPIFTSIIMGATIGLWLNFVVENWRAAKA